ncbi:MAG: pentapeptide repeat-containing protein, partial [Gammaproteobacteria bacterium]|nr:pentapeptide repeat-containing protein [Gammaproteobacteria bacterium]
RNLPVNSGRISGEGASSYYFLYILFSDKSDLYVEAAFLLLDVKTKNEALKFLGISMGGLLVGLQAFISYRRAKAMEDTVENTEKGMRQERLKNAIEHLGHESASIRLGGAYELFHLAQDTKELRQTVLDILCSHIRRTTSEDEYRDNHKSEPSEEIQILLNLLFVQEHEIFEDCHINLQGSWLNGAELSKARLEKAVLNSSYLQAAILNKAQLKGVWLNEAQLQGASLVQARLQTANLNRTRFQKADLTDAYLQESILNGALLTGANLAGAHLQETGLNGTNLQGAYLVATEMQMASLAGASLQDAFLQGTKMQGVNLWDTQIQGACFRSVQLHGAEFSSLQNFQSDNENLRQEINPEPAYLQGVRYHDDGITGDFAQRMRDGVGKENDFSGVIFAGGVSRKYINSIVNGLSDSGAKKLRELLEPHIDQPVSHELPKDSGAITEPYTEEKAEQWIANYEKAMSEVSKEGDS